MCGIVAIHAYQPLAAPVDRTELQAVRDHMAARGPDGMGEWFSADMRLGLGHRRLSIIDLSERGAQPMATADGQCVITFNGEIYNYRQLRGELQLRGRVFSSDSDTEVLLHLYEEYGTGMLEKLRGMFAFALWDGRKRALLLARDAFGIKPLYYADDGRTLRAASQVKALLQARVDASPDPAGHAGFFLWGSVPSPWTLYKGIRALPPGHFMWVRNQDVEAPEPFCVISDILAQAAANPTQGSREEALEQIAVALHDSVAAHLVADVPVATFLSAGMDSSMICSLLPVVGVQPRTLTLAFGEFAGTPNDEAPMAESIARQFNTRHSTLVVRRADFEGERSRLLEAMDQPSIDGVNTWFVARAAASQGIKVALSGLGGDEIFASYPSFRDVPRITNLARHYAAVPRLGYVMRRLTAPMLQHFTSPKYAGLLEYGGTNGGAYMLRRGLHMPWELPKVMDPDMAREGWRELQTIAHLDETCASLSRNPRLAVSALELSWYTRNQLLNDADWAGMAHSVEIRVPLLDLELLKATAPCFARYPELTKRQVVEAAAPALRGPLLAKPKTGFVVPVRDWLSTSGSSKAGRGLRGWAKEIHEEHTLQQAAALSRLGPVAAPRVLVSTLTPGNGGVNAMTSFVVRTLARRGLQPIIAHYAPYSLMPALSVPSYRLLQRSPGAHQCLTFGNKETHAIGAWLPELEFTHYAPTRHWRRLIESCDAFVVASGNVLAATPFQQTRRPFLAWVATDWEGDRRDRVKHFPAARRWLDTYVNTPIIRRLEKSLLRSGKVLSLSEYTAQTLAQLAGPEFRTRTLPVPVDTELFFPALAARVPGRLGFAGRFNDPRKNIDLMLQTVTRLRNDGTEVHAVLMGDTPSSTLMEHIHSLGLEPHLIFKPGLSREQMRDVLQSLDLFVLPSHQEGLCIAALEAMACGVPVVSTRCGGPEEFVLPGTTGLLVDSTPQAMAQAIATIIGDEVLRGDLSEACRKLIEERYSLTRSENIFGEAFATAFPALAGHFQMSAQAPKTADLNMNQMTPVIPEAT